MWLKFGGWASFAMRPSWTLILRVRAFVSVLDFRYNLVSGLLGGWYYAGLLLSDGPASLRQKVLETLSSIGKGRPNSRRTILP
jgi:hypothetical protein